MRSARQSDPQGITHFRSFLNFCYGLTAFGIALLCLAFALKASRTGLWFHNPFWLVDTGESDLFFFLTISGSAALIWVMVGAKRLPLLGGIEIHASDLIPARTADSWLSGSMERARRIGFQIADEAHTRVRMAARNPEAQELTLEIRAEGSGLAGRIQHRFSKRSGSLLASVPYAQQLVAFVSGRQTNVPEHILLNAAAFASLFIASILAGGAVTAALRETTGELNNLACGPLGVACAVAAFFMRSKPPVRRVGASLAVCALALIAGSQAVLALGTPYCFGEYLDNHDLEEGSRAAEADYDAGRSAWRRAGLVILFKGQVSDVDGIPWHNTG